MDIILDALAVLNTNLSQQLILELVLTSSPPNFDLFRRYLIHLSGMERPPSKVNLLSHLVERIITLSLNDVY
jgi:hypothetical protein